MEHSTTDQSNPTPRARQKLAKTLPTDRVPFPKQLELIRAYAAAAEKVGGAVSNADAGKFVGLADSTIATTNAYFCDIGLLQKVESGKFVPSQPLVEHFKVYQLSADRSWAKLAPLFEKWWAGQELIPKLRFRPIDESEAITDLAIAANAERSHYGHLKIAIDWLAQVGLVSREGGQLRLVTQSTPMLDPAPVSPPPSGNTGDGKALLEALQRPALGGINFAISLNVDMNQMAAWPAENIKEFFAGVAQVLAAKAAAERQEP